MKNRASNAPSRRMAAPQKPVQLPLRSRATREPIVEDDPKPKGPFWKWVAIIALLHLILFVSVALFHEVKKPVPPPEQFMSLLPTGDAVKGSPGEQQAPTVKPVVPSPTAEQEPTPPPPSPTPPTPTPQPSPQEAATPPQPTPPPEAVVPPPTAVTPPPTPVPGPVPEPRPEVSKPVAIKPPPAKPKVTHNKPKPKPKSAKAVVKTVAPAPPIPDVVTPEPPPEPITQPEKPVAMVDDVPPTDPKLLPPPDPVPDKPLAKVEKPKPVTKKEKAPSTAESAPAKPKVKLDKSDLQLADGPETDTPSQSTDSPKPSTAKKEKSAAKATSTAKATDSSSTTTSQKTDEAKADKAAKSEKAEKADKPAVHENPGLSAAEIAAQFGKKLEDAGVNNSVKVGTSGSTKVQDNPYAGFYRSVRDQVMSKWEHPNLSDETANNPEVTIHVEKDGRVPVESVTLSRSSGNQAYDDSALAAAKSLGYTLQPLPEGCPPDIHINFKLTR